MKSLFAKKSSNVLGIDIGSKYVKAVELSAIQGVLQVVSYAYEPIIGQAINDREIKDFDAVSRALKKVSMAMKSKNKNIAIAVAGGAVISKIIHMDQHQSDFELENQIEIEADSLIPYPLEEVYLDFERLKLSTTHLDKVEVLLTAAHKDIVDSRLTLVRESKYAPQIVDTETNALANAFLLQNPDSEAPQCLVNIGASLLQLCVIQGGEVIYAKEHNFGLNKLVSDIALINNTDEQSIESQLHTNSLPEEQLREPLNMYITTLQQQLDRALQMYVNSTHKALPSKISLAGGISRLHKISELLSVDWPYECALFDPFLNIALSDKISRTSLQAMKSQLAIATGLASRSIQTWHK